MFIAESGSESSSNFTLTDEIDEVECDALLEDINSHKSTRSWFQNINIAEKSTNTNIISRQSKKIQTVKVETRAIAAQTYLDMNFSFFEMTTSPKIKNEKEVQTNPEHKIAVQIDVRAQNDVLGFQSHVLSRMDAFTVSISIASAIDNTAYERDQENLAKDIVSQSSNSEEESSDSEADSGAEHNLID